MSLKNKTSQYMGENIVFYYTAVDLFLGFKSDELKKNLTKDDWFNIYHLMQFIEVDPKRTTCQL